MLNVDAETGEIVTPFLRSAFNYDRNAASDASGLSCPEPSLAQQQFKEDSDINTIVKRFGITGALPQNVRVPMGGDFTEAVTDYRTALDNVIEAQKGFMAMPADVRKRFQNDPGAFLAFVEDPKNRDEAKKLGLLMADAVAAEPMLVKVVAEPTPGTSST